MGRIYSMYNALKLLLIEQRIKKNRKRRADAAMNYFVNRYISWDGLLYVNMNHKIEIGKWKRREKKNKLKQQQQQQQRQ
jgi:hypothetical protein